MTLAHPKYRPDIDGLRAIAIILVLLFHAFPNMVVGGFIGVDVFFVISGYLISTIIISSLDRNEFGFLEFYSRRIRRIFPALLIVLLLCLVFGWFALLPDEYKQLGKHVAGGTAFVSNFVLWSESGYFDIAVEKKLLLHLWSLGIEEQFYILRPLFLWLGWKFRLNFIAMTISIATISFASGVYLLDLDKTMAFYMPHARFWELMIGAGLAYTTMRDAKIPSFASSLTERWTHLLGNIKSILGVALIAVGAVFIDKTSNFPGWYALFPTIGAALIISAGVGAWINKRFLSSRVMVWIGLISFPLYLWHWPILSYARILATQEPSISYRVGLIIVSTVLAWLTYELVERPVRFSVLKHMIVWILISICVAIASLALFTYYKDGFESRTSNVKGGVVNDLKYRHGGFYENARDCSSIFPSQIINTWCAENTETPVVAILGDSHAGQLFLGIRDSNHETFSKAIFMGAGSCYPTIGIDSREGCGRQLELALRIIEKSKSIKYVFVAAFYGWSEKGADASLLYINGYKKTLDRLIAQGKNVIFVVDNPALNFDPEVCMLKNRPINEFNSRFGASQSACMSDRTSNLKNQSVYFSNVKELIKMYPDVLFYDPRDRLCTDGDCKIIDSGNLLYSDWNHLSKYGSLYLANDIISRINKKW